MTKPARLPADHEARVGRMLLSLDGLSLGDAFGERFFVKDAEDRIAARALPPAPWRTTDDTAMALGVVEVVDGSGSVLGEGRDALARVLARRHAEEPHRGYGAGAHEILFAIAAGEPWPKAAALPFGGQGSMGNGAAMRVAPLGAYFADDLERVSREARASAEVTHGHPEGQAGAIAVALAAALASRLGGRRDEVSGSSILEQVVALTPPGETRDGLRQACAIPFRLSPEAAAHHLGSGYRIVSPDTVPFALWCAARHLGDFEEAMWATVAGLGDRDTTCAIAGGVVALSAGRASSPPAWLEAREPLRLHPARA